MNYDGDSEAKIGLVATVVAARFIESPKIRK